MTGNLWVLLLEMGQESVCSFKPRTSLEKKKEKKNKEKKPKEKNQPNQKHFSFPTAIFKEEVQLLLENS